MKAIFTILIIAAALDLFRLAAVSSDYGYKTYPDFWRAFGIIERDCK